MNNLFEIVALTAVIGAGATLAMDVWRFFLQKAFGINSLDLALLGRWVAYVFRGRVVHKPIAKSNKISGELLIGWISHYAIGMTLAGLLPLFYGRVWLSSPSLLPALTVGIATVFAPWFIMQPAMGLGIAARRAQSPFAVRLRNLAIHTVYAFGLYAAARGLQWLVGTGRSA